MRRSTLALVCLIAVALAGSAAGAGGPQWKTFGDAAWRPDTGYNSQHGLVTQSNCLTPTCATDFLVTFGGIQLLNGPTDPASITAASFDFNPSATGGSGGSPRLVFLLSDGGNIQLRPLPWVANTWTHQDGFGGTTATDWDNYGGICGFAYEQTYTAALACHLTGTTVTAIFLVNDSGWIAPPGETVTVDNITVNSIVAAGPGNST